ncbi:MAG: RIP metalloprotease RseP [Planctomycetota bacterium]|nr:MAG: RIP metalloprotease RseP [Planctomycetota bacterium]
MIESFANGALALLGISFLIFMHELGHFVAARAFGVRVETFSIGFGRRIAGFHRDGTDYRLSLVPLGGYVKMAGEYGDFDDEQVLDPGDLASKPIWQRFIIFSAGVVVNIALAFVIYPVAFGLGVPFMSPSIGTLVPGGAAWRAGGQVGDQILSVNGNTVYGFEDVGLEVALGDPEHTVLHVLRGERELDLVLQSDRVDSRWDAGIYPPASARLVVASGEQSPKPAERAGLLDGDVLLAANGLGVGQVYRGRTLGAREVLQRARTSGQDLVLSVERAGQRLDFTLTPEALDSQGGRRLLGAVPLARRVAALRGPAAAADFPLAVDDVIMTLAGAPLLDRELLLVAAEQGPLELSIRRHEQLIEAKLTATQAQALLSGDVALAGDETQRFIQPLKGGALEDAGALPGDEIVSLDGQPLADYAALLSALKNSHEDVVVHRVGLARGEQSFDLDVRMRPLPIMDDGLDLKPVEITHDLDLAGSIAAGWNASTHALQTTAMTLGKLFTGSVGMENLGGPLSISFITYKSAEMDFAKLLFFLALLSVNLGFINILPIPVLDGGQIVFLMCEKVKGSRLSDGFMQNAQLVGLVAILALMVVVTYNDILRFFA